MDGIQTVMYQTALDLAKQEVKPFLRKQVPSELNELGLEHRIAVKGQSIHVNVGTTLELPPELKSVLDLYSWKLNLLFLKYLHRPVRDSVYTYN